MTDVSVEELKEYVSILHDMYLHKLVQEQMEQDIETKVSVLAKPQNYDEPIPPVKYSPEVEESEEPSLYINYGYILLAIGALIVAFFVGILALGLVIGILCLDRHDSLAGPLNVFITVAMIIWMGFVLFCAIAVIADDYKHKIDAVKGKNSQIRKRNENAQKRYDEQYAEYTRKIKEYKRAVYSEKKRLAVEKPEKERLLECLAQLKRKSKESSERLAEMKSNGILYGKYCEIVPICYIYEYLITGRCETRKEAYNMYEQESRLDNISSALRGGFSTLTDLLKNIIDNQQVSLQNQYALISAVEESNRLSAQVLENTYRLANETTALQDSLLALTEDTLHVKENLYRCQKDVSRIHDTMDMVSYNTERTRKEIEYMNWISRYSDKHGNQPQSMYS